MNTLEKQETVETDKNQAVKEIIDETREKIDYEATQLFEEPENDEDNEEKEREQNEEENEEQQEISIYEATQLYGTVVQETINEEEVEKPIFEDTRISNLEQEREEEEGEKDQADISIYETTQVYGEVTTREAQIYKEIKNEAEGGLEDISGEIEAEIEENDETKELEDEDDETYVQAIARNEDQAAEVDTSIYEATQIYGEVTVSIEKEVAKDIDSYDATQMYELEEEYGDEKEIVEEQLPENVDETNPEALACEATQLYDETSFEHPREETGENLEDIPENKKPEAHDIESEESEDERRNEAPDQEQKNEIEIEESECERINEAPSQENKIENIYEDEATQLYEDDEAEELSEQELREGEQETPFVSKPAIGTDKETSEEAEKLIPELGDAQEIQHLNDEFQGIEKVEEENLPKKRKESPEHLDTQSPLKKKKYDSENEKTEAEKETEADDVSLVSIDDEIYLDHQEEDKDNAFEEAATSSGWTGTRRNKRQHEEGSFELTEEAREVLDHKPKKTKLSEEENKKRKRQDDSRVDEAERNEVPRGFKRNKEEEQIEKGGEVDELSYHQTGEHLA